MAAVDIRIRHQQDLVVARARDVEIVLAFFGVLAWSSNAGPKGLDQRTDLLAVEHFVEARPLDVQNLAFQRQDGLEPTISPLLGRAPGRISFDDEQLAMGRILLRAIGELSGKGA